MSTLPDHDPRCLDTAAAAVDLLIQGRPRDVGTMVVTRLLPSPRRRMVGPFVFLDHMGPVEIPAGVGFDVPPHPHIGLATLTYFLAGQNVHRDSIGTVQAVGPGDLNLMTAGRGVVHSERADPAWRARGGVMHGVQMWLALPEAHEDDEPSCQFHPGGSLPALAPAMGARGRLLAGTAYGATSPVEHPSAPLLVDLELDPGATVALPDAPERGVFVIDGEVTIAEQVVTANQLMVVVDRAAAVLVAKAPTRLLILGGPAMSARFIDWNFVASTQDRIDAAREAWKARRFATIPGDQDEFVPYPAWRR